MTTEQVTLSGVTVPAGGPVLAPLLPANRDPARVSQADRLDIVRQDATPSTSASGAAVARVAGG